jgi:Holliday junction resolvasome RuvABC endonuclease subunit
MQVKYVLGADLSLTNSGLCFINKYNCDDFITYNVSCRYTGIERLAWCKRKFTELFKTHETECVFVEDYAFAAKGRGLTGLAELGGIFRCLLYDELKIPYATIAPTRLKKYTTGKGQAKKHVMLEQVFRKYGIGSEVLDTTDVVDAYALARFCTAFWSWRTGAEEAFPITSVNLFKDVLRGGFYEPK